MGNKQSEVGRPRPNAGSVDRRVDVLLALGASIVVAGIALLLARVYWDSYDASIMGQVATGILDHHTTRVPFDPYHLNSPHSFYGVGMSLLMLPTAALFKVTGGSAVAGTMVTNVWLLGALCAITYGWCRIRYIERGASLAVAIATALGAGLLNYAATGMAEVALADAVALGLLGISAMSAGRAWGPWLVGAAAGASVVIRDDSALLVLPWLIGGALLAPRDRISTGVRLAGGGALFAAIWCWYNDARYGAPWRVGYHGVVKLNHSFFAGLYGLVLSPGRGLLLYAPLTVVAAFYVRKAWRRDRILTGTAIGLVVGRFVFYSPYWGWYGGGGFGPRYVIAGMPAIAVGLMEAALGFPALRAGWKVLVVAIAGLSAAIGFVGGAVNYNRNSLQAALSRDPVFSLQVPSAQVFLNRLEAPTTQSFVDHEMFQWSLFPITNEARMLVHRQNLSAPGIGRPSDKARDALAILLVAGGAVAVGLGLRREHARGRTSEVAVAQAELPGTA